MYDTEAYMKILKNTLSSRRFYHSLCVSQSAKKLAERYNQDVEKAEIAGLLHDITKETGKAAQLEIIKSNFENEEEFYQLERNIVLRSIDDLWMRHIDSMSNLRQSVAFEWYAQRNPLIVYKEKSFEAFDKLFDDIAYITTKTILTVKQNIEIEQKRINEENLIVSQIEDEILNITKDEPNNSNPLFSQPQNTTNSNWKTKIRV